MPMVEPSKPLFKSFENKVWHSLSILLDHKCSLFCIKKYIYIENIDQPPKYVSICETFQKKTCLEFYIIL